MLNGDSESMKNGREVAVCSARDVQLEEKQSRASELLIYLILNKAQEISSELFHCLPKLAKCQKQTQLPESDDVEQHVPAISAIVEA